MIATDGSCGFQPQQNYAYPKESLAGSAAALRLCSVQALAAVNAKAANMLMVTSKTSFNCEQHKGVTATAVPRTRHSRFRTLLSGIIFMK